MKSPLITVVALAAIHTLGAADLQSLVDNSPFGRPPPAESQPVLNNEAALEFRSLIVEGDRRYFSVFDPSSQRGYWLQEGDSEEQADFTVSSYDADDQRLVVSRSGRNYDLVLKQASIVAGTMPAAVTAPGDNNRNTSNVRPSGGNAADARRLEAVAAEVRRRRALRQAAANQTVTQ